MQATSFRRLGCASVLAMSMSFCSASVFAQVASLDAAVKTATVWAVQADANQAGRMWGESNAIMQKSISKDDWAKYLNSLHTELGKLTSRDWVQIIRMGQPANLPQGEYINVIFSSRFANADTAEAVSLVQNGKGWMPVGYIIRKAQPATPAAK